MNLEVASVRSKVNARPSVAVVGSILIFLLALLALSWRESTVAQSRAQFSIQVTSSSFVDGGMIPQKFTCDSADFSPDLQWTTLPGKTKSLALVMHDPDALADFTHWVAYNIPSSAGELALGASPRAAMPKGSNEGINDFSHLGYGGPCPPPGKPHHYIFTLYALDALLDLPAGQKRAELEFAMRQHVIAEGRITGLYRR